MSGFIKTHRDAASAAEALRRPIALHGQGLATPAPMPGPVENDIHFDRIEGTSGRVLIAENLDSLLQSVARLHRSYVSDLPPFDPYLRIRPRLHLSDVTAVHAIVEETVPTGDATLHGDLHSGQFIRDAGGTVWIVDLDDLAIGPPEADIANLVAHLATSGTGFNITRWSSVVRRVWFEQGQCLSQDVFSRFLRLALVRRHLKLREAGRPDFEPEVLAYLRESSNFSIR